MKKLLKSTFKSIFSNKVVVILLALVVFVTSSTYTLIQSTSSEFAKSYDHVVTKGNIHDFTIKEKFSTNGEIPIKAEEASTGKSLITADATKNYVWETTVGKEIKNYVIIPAEHSPVQVTGEMLSLFSSWANQKIKMKDGTEQELGDLTHPVPLDIRVPADKIKITEDPVSHAQSLDLIYRMEKDESGVEHKVFDVEVYSPRTTISKWGGEDDWDTPLFYESAPLDQMKQRDISSLWTKITIPADIVAGDKGTKSLFNRQPDGAGYRDDLAGQDLTQGVYHATTDGYHKYIFTPRNTMDEFKANLKSFIDSEHLFKAISVHDVMVTPDINFTDITKSNVTGDFYKYLNSLKQNNPSEYSRLYEQVLVNQIYVDPTTITSSTGSTSTIVPQPSNASIDKAKKEMKQQVYLNIRQNALKKFSEAIHTKYKNEVEFKHIKGITVAGIGDSKLYKFIENEPNTYTDKTVIFDGTNVSQPTQGATLKAAQDWAHAHMGEVQKNSLGEPVIINRGFKVIVKREINKMEATPRVFIDPTSVQTVVSPTFAKRNNIKPMSKEALNSQEFKDLMNNATEDNMARFHAKHPQSTIQANSLMYVVTGIGITPDFAYPIIDSHHPIPDLDNEALLYVNSSGYLRVEESFRDNLRESYFAGKFVEGISEARKIEIKKDLEAMAQSMMSWPNDIQIVRDYDDITEKVIMAPHRITFLEKLNHSIRTISIVITTLLITLASLIVTLIIKRNISKQRKTLSILSANGYTKNQIAFSYIWASSIIVGVSTILGFLVGHGMQFVMFNIFSNFWTIPTSTHAFSWVALLITVIIPVVGVGVISYAFSIWELRGSIVLNMAGAKKSIGHWVSAKSLSRMHWVGIKTKLATSFFLTNLSKAVMIFVSAAGAIIASSMAFTMLGKFDYAVSATDAVNNYKYSVDMASPTQEGGQYAAVIKQDPTKPIIFNGEDISEIKNKWGKTRPTRYWAGMDNSVRRGEIIESPSSTEHEKSMFHSPSGNDLKVMKNGLAGQGGGWSEGSGSIKPEEINKFYKNVDDVTHYLKNRVQFKALLNVSLGGGLLGKYNPWDMAEGVMPSNQVAEANKDYIGWFERALKAPSNATVIANYKNEVIGKTVVEVTKADGTELVADIEDGTLWLKSKVTGPYALKRDIYGHATKAEKSNGVQLWQLDDGTKFGNPSSLVLYAGPNYDYPIQEGKTARSNTKWQFIRSIEELIETSKTGTQDEMIIKARNFDSVIANSPSFSSGPKDSFVTFVSNAIKDGIYPYSIYYNQVVMDPKDETYTSIRGKMNRKNIKGDVELLDINIKGIYNDTKYVKLGDENMKALTDYNYVPGKEIPVLINKFTSKFYKLGIGDTFKMHIDNKSDRHLYHDQSNQDTFKIVGEVNSYSNIELFTLKGIANDVLKLDKVNGFNGVFSDSEAPSVLTSVNIYSESGIYPPFDTIPQDIKESNYELISTWLGHESSQRGYNTIPAYLDGKKEAVTDVDQFVTRYTKSIYKSIVSDVQWAAMVHYAFVSVNGITSDIIALGEAVALFIAIVFIIILGSMMVDANKINIATMKVMGYRDSEIRNSFIKSFLPTILIGALIAIPFVFGLLAAAQLSIMAFGKVLIPMTMLGWEIVAASVLVSGIFLTIFIGSIRKLKGQSALAAFTVAE